MWTHNIDKKLELLTEFMKRLTELETHNNVNGQYVKCNPPTLEMAIAYEAFTRPKTFEIIQPQTVDDFEVGTGKATTLEGRTLDSSGIRWATGKDVSLKKVPKLEVQDRVPSRLRDFNTISPEARLYVAENLGCQHFKYNKTTKGWRTLYNPTSIILDLYFDTGKFITREAIFQGQRQFKRFKDLNKKEYNNLQRKLPDKSLYIKCN